MYACTKYTKKVYTLHEYILVHMFHIHSVGDFHGQRMLQYIDKEYILGTPFSSLKNCLQRQKLSPYEGRGEVSMHSPFVLTRREIEIAQPVLTKTFAANHARHPSCVQHAKRRNGPARGAQDLSTASQNSLHVHGMSWLCPPTSPYPIFMLIIFKTNCTNW